MNKRSCEQGPKHLCHLLSQRQLAEGLRKEIAMICSLKFDLIKKNQWIRECRDGEKALPPFLYSLIILFFFRWKNRQESLIQGFYLCVRNSLNNGQNTSGLHFWDCVSVRLCCCPSIKIFNHDYSQILKVMKFVC